MELVALVLLASAIGVLCGSALFRAAERHGRNRWAWGVAGLLTNVVAVLVFRVRVGQIMPL